MGTELDGSQDDKEAAAAERMRRRSLGVEESIRAAQEAGAFDNLPGRGKPLRLDDASGDWWLAFHMLKSAGHAPDWIERSGAIRQGEEALTAGLVRTAAWARQELEAAAALPEPKRAARLAEIDTALTRKSEAARGDIQRLNDQIDRYNLLLPAGVARRPRINADEVLERVFAGLSG